MKIFDSFDGVKIAYRLFGEGRPTLLLHTILGNADLDWFQPGIAQAIAATGRLVIAPDFRGHGNSAVPTESIAYPPDALAMDQEALLKHLNIGAYDLVGYAMGARMAIRMLVRGAMPGRCVLGGMGDTGVMQVAGRKSYYEDAIRNGPNAANTASGRYVQDAIAQRALKPEAMLNVLFQQVDTVAKALATVDVPVLVVSGKQDEDNGSAERLAEAFANGKAQRIPGNHLSAITTPEFVATTIEFLDAPAT